MIPDYSSYKIALIKKAMNRALKIKTIYAYIIAILICIIILLIIY